jgi:hypothetical protein
MLGKTNRTAITLAEFAEWLVRTATLWLTIFLRPLGSLRRTPKHLPVIPAKACPELVVAGISFSVIPAKAGIQTAYEIPQPRTNAAWIPAFAGMRKRLRMGLLRPSSNQWRPIVNH